MDIFSSIHYRVLKLCDKSSIGRQIYSKFLLPWDRFVLNVEHRFLGKVYSSYYEEVEKTLNLYLTEEQKKDAKYVKALKKDLLNCWLSLRIYPPEYFLYEFEKLNDNQRREYISDIERWEVLHKLFGAKVRHEHADKWLFYQMAKPYFHRDACKVGGDAPKSDYLAFVAKHPRFFVKELEGCFGRNAYILEVHSTEYMEEVYDRLVTHGEWILEELIIQSSDLSAWNASSVNTVRIASFLTSKGEHHVVMPFFRAGRVGSIVDNALSGGMVAGVDEKTGRLCSDGFDEHGNRYVVHPDSKVHVKGWQVPQWEELCKMTEELHRSLPRHHRYLAFDFAHTENGWVLVEGNWGQLIFNQAGAHRGIRKQFLEYLK